MQFYKFPRRQIFPTIYIFLSYFIECIKSTKNKNSQKYSSINSTKIMPKTFIKTNTIKTIRKGPKINPPNITKLHHSKEGIYRNLDDFN